jgi:5-methylcytosine-specific restriction enzyme A
VSSQAPAADLRTRRISARRVRRTAWWQAYVELSGGRCAYCHVAEEALTLEHIEPLANGGTNAPDNLLPVCGDCNHAKGSLSLRAFVEEWTFAAAEGKPHPLGRIEDGVWILSDAAVAIQSRRERTARRRLAGVRATAARAIALPPVRRRVLGEIAYAAAYDA